MLGLKKQQSGIQERLYSDLALNRILKGITGSQNLLHTESSVIFEKYWYLAPTPTHSNLTNMEHDLDTNSFKSHPGDFNVQQVWKPLNYSKNYSGSIMYNEDINFLIEQSSESSQSLQNRWSKSKTQWKG